MPNRLLVVFDVDNTLYDWVAVWADAFRAMLDVLVAGTSTPRTVWLERAHAVHVHCRATEVPSLVEALAQPNSEAPAEVYCAAAAAYREVWRARLRVYDGLRETLSQLAAAGHRSVAYTEADVSIAAGRLSRLGLAPSLSGVFGRAALPRPRDPRYSLVEPSLRSLPIVTIAPNVSKPHPDGLRAVVRHSGTPLADVVYVGDNVFKDVMAGKSLGVTALWARYGTARRADDARLLEAIAHWSTADVAEERAIATPALHADATIDSAFALLPVLQARTARALAVSSHG